MAAIREYIEATIPETYQLVTQGLNLPDGTPTDALDGKIRIDIFGIEITRAMAVLFKTGVTEGDLSEISKSYVADTVTLRTITGLIDYYMVKTRLNDSMGRSSGTVPLGGESSTNYNRVEVLQHQASMVSDRLNDASLDFAADAGALLRTTGSRAALGAKISGDGTKRTDDPYQFQHTYGPWFPGGIFGAGFGIPVILDVVLAEESIAAPFPEGRF